MDNRSNTAVFSHRALIVCVNKAAPESTDVHVIYEAARYAWGVNVEKAKHAQIVLAVRRNTVIGVFVAEKWLVATELNFPGREPNPKRYGFVGSFAKQDVWQRYVGKRLSQEHRLYGPIRYIGC